MLGLTGLKLILRNPESFIFYLYFICTDNYNLNIERVKLRVEGGGLDVSTEKIVERSTADS
jgi:predicted ABC-type ATPase